MMQANGTISTKIHEREEERVDMAEATVGDRLNQLLRERGRADRGVPYSQTELTAMLNGEMRAPDGKYYNVGTNRSTVSRYLRDEREMPYDALRAICEMFHESADWILFGRVLEPETRIERFVSDEANEVGAIVDDLPPALRGIIRQGAQLLHRMHQEQQALLTENHERDIQIAMLLERNINLLAADTRKEAHEHIAHIRRRRSGAPPVAPTNH